MNSNALIPVGTILKTKGFDGTLLVEFYYEIHHDVFKVLFIKTNEIETPLLISKSHQDSESTYGIQFQSYDTKEKAQKLNGTTVYMSEDMALKHFDVIEDDDYIGYEVYDRDLFLGTVVEVYTTKFQETLEIEEPHGTKFLIPFVDELLNEIDPDTRKIVYELPLGYLDSIKI